MPPFVLSFLFFLGGKEKWKEDNNIIHIKSIDITHCIINLYFLIIIYWPRNQGSGLWLG